MKSIISKWKLFLLASLIFSACRNQQENSPSDAKKEKKITLFEAFNGFALEKFHPIDSVENLKLKATPIDEMKARTDINTFFGNLKLGNPNVKCIIDIQNLDSVFRALQNMNADGLRVYAAEYTPATAMGRQPGTMHLILVPIDESGNEIKTDLMGNTSIFNYNRDCPDNCIAVNKASLLTDNQKTFCKNARP